MASEHGTFVRYTSGCRCPSCTYANTVHSREFRAELKRLAAIGRAAEAAVKNNKRSNA